MPRPAGSLATCPTCNAIVLITPKGVVKHFPGATDCPTEGTTLNQ
jgi:hypothetical protein